MVNVVGERGKMGRGGESGERWTVIGENEERWTVVGESGER